MIRINLLPFRKARKKENVRQQVTIFVLAVVLLILGMYYYQTILSRKLQVLDDKIKVSQQQLADLGKLTKEIWRKNAGRRSFSLKQSHPW